eukprot:2538479-Pyramimonas_sp.AAC.1
MLCLVSCSVVAVLLSADLKSSLGADGSVTLQGSANDFQDGLERAPVASERVPLGPNARPEKAT